MYCVLIFLLEINSMRLLREARSEFALCWGLVNSNHIKKLKSFFGGIMLLMLVSDSSNIDMIVELVYRSS